MTILKHIKILIILLLSFAMLTQMIFAEFKGEIKAPEGTVIEPDEDIVDYGLCFIGDTIEKVFTLKNTGSEILKLGSTDPTYLKGEYLKIANHTNDHYEFNRPFGDVLPYLIPPGTNRELKMIYIAEDTTGEYKAGKKYAILKLGLYDSKIPDQPPPGYKDMKVLDSFLLIARKTTHYIDGYESENYFDSVYVNPPAKVLWIWQVKNVSKSDLVIDNDTIIPLSPNPDFMINKVMPLPIYQKNVIDWEIEYYPKDKGGDSAIYQLKYHPHPNQYPDSVDYAKVKLYGIGVKQDMTLDFCDNVKDYNEDTLDIGEVWVDSTKETMAVLKNKGNMKFGTISQSILNNKDVPDSVFTLLGGIKELPFNLDTNKTDTFRIKFNPKQRGAFISSFILNSDIASRKIKGIPADGLNEIIYLKGTGIEPEISVASDILDMGNVVLHLDCPSADTVPLRINNIGNTTLWIQDSWIDPPFKRIPIDTIAANSQGNILVIFKADSFMEVRDYSDTLFIVSRDVRPPKDTLKIIVKVSIVNPQETRLNIPTDIKAKPGRLISVPIIVDKNNIDIARIFNDTLTYNPTLLRYSSYENIGTASEGAIPALLKIEPIGDSSRLSIYIEMPPNDYFQPRDTLIKLKFNTYLGDNISTSIAFANPKFSNGPCSKVLTPIDSNGVFSLDSICGLNLKIRPVTTKLFRFEDIYPNPANDKIQFEYEMAFNSSIKINMFNSYGELVEKLIDTELPAGTYLLTYPTSVLTPGVYYFEMKSGLFRQIKKVVLTK